MTNTTQGFCYLVFDAAGVAFLVVVVAFLGYLAFSWFQGGSQGRSVIGQEIIWTLVPALVLVGLAAMSDIPWELGKGQERPASGDVLAFPR
jgi:H+/Cl- antiporter ClcA